VKEMVKFQEPSTRPSLTPVIWHSQLPPVTGVSPTRSSPSKSCRSLPLITSLRPGDQRRDAKHSFDTPLGPRIPAWTTIGERDRERREAQVGDLDGFGARNDDLKRRFLGHKGGFLPEASLDVDWVLHQPVDAQSGQ
jgi:hypothetical protein